MKYEIGNHVTVKKSPGGGISVGESFPILKIGRDGDPDCYGVVSRYDGEVYFLHEDDVARSTNAEYVRTLDDSLFATFVYQLVCTQSPELNGKKLKTLEDCKACLIEPSNK